MRGARLAGRAEKRQNKNSSFRSLRSSASVSSWANGWTDGQMEGRVNTQLSSDVISDGWSADGSPFFGDDFIDLRERLTEMENAKACLEYPRRRTLITPPARGTTARGEQKAPRYDSRWQIFPLRDCAGSGRSLISAAVPTARTVWASADGYLTDQDVSCQ